MTSIRWKEFQERICLVLDTSGCIKMFIKIWYTVSHLRHMAKVSAIRMVNATVLRSPIFFLLGLGFCLFPTAESGPRLAQPTRSLLHRCLVSWGGRGVGKRKARGESPFPSSHYPPRAYKFLDFAMFIGIPMGVSAEDIQCHDHLLE